VAKQASPGCKSKMWLESWLCRNSAASAPLTSATPKKGSLQSVCMVFSCVLANEI